MIDFFNIFRKKRIKLIKQEIKEKQKLADIQSNLNDLLREEKEIESA